MRWRSGGAELNFVTREIAAAASRAGTVSVLIPGTPGSIEPDGAFDLLGVGEADDLHWPLDLPNHPVVIVDHLTGTSTGLLAKATPTSVYYLTNSVEPLPEWRRLRFVDDGSDLPLIEPYVAVNAIAEHHRHHGFGFTDYILVLSDRMGPQSGPPDQAAWITGAFHDRDVIVVENAMASAWKGRALRGTVSVDSRMDLWRLMAHASVCIDLNPGQLLARECVEALRFGTPIVVPKSAGAAYTHSMLGGAAFDNPAELIDTLDTLSGPEARAASSVNGRTYADAHYGDPDRFVKMVGSLMARS
jgi:hypothetical protein